MHLPLSPLQTNNRLRQFEFHVRRIRRKKQVLAINRCFETSAAVHTTSRLRWNNHVPRNFHIFLIHTIRLEQRDNSISMSTERGNCIFQSFRQVLHTSTSNMFDNIVTNDWITQLVFCHQERYRKHTRANTERQNNNALNIHISIVCSNKMQVITLQEFFNRQHLRLWQGCTKPSGIQHTHHGASIPQAITVLPIKRTVKQRLLTNKFDQLIPNFCRNLIFFPDRECICQQLLYLDLLQLLDVTTKFFMGRFVRIATGTWTVTTTFTIFTTFDSPITLLLTHQAPLVPRLHSFTIWCQQNIIHICNRIRNNRIYTRGNRIDSDSRYTLRNRSCSATNRVQGSSDR